MNFLVEKMFTANSIKLLRSCQLVSTRNYAFKSDLKIKWNRPEKISCIKPEKSGDLKPLEPINAKYILGFETSKELQDADPLVKSKFEIENNPRRHTIEIAKKNMISSVNRHSLDMGSVEAKLAEWTVKIRSMQEYMEKFPRNKVVKVQLKELIDKRKRHLRYLRRWDYRRFEWILEKLDLVYKPYPAEFHWITRKESLQKLTDIHCNNIKEERLNEYRKSLESQQIPFLEDKIKNLEFIKSEQITCQVPVTVRSEEIDECKKKLQQLKLKQQEIDESNKLQHEKEGYDFDLLRN